MSAERKEETRTRKLHDVTTVGRDNSEAWKKGWFQGQLRLLKEPKKTERLKEIMLMPLTHLNLTMNNLTKDHAPIIAECLKNNTTLEMLNLGLNLIGASGVRHLAEVLKSNNSLVLLYLEATDASKGVVQIAESLRINSTLQILDLRDSNVVLEGAKILLNVLAKDNRSLTTLLLSGNRLGGCGDALAETLKLNTALCYLEMNSCQMGPWDFSRFAEPACQSNTLQKFFVLEGNVVSLEIEKKLLERFPQISTRQIHEKLFPGDALGKENKQTTPLDKEQLEKERIEKERIEKEKVKNEQIAVIERGDPIGDKWSIEQTVLFLQRSTDFASFANSFAQNHIDGEVLMELSEDNLINTFQMTLGQAKKFKKLLGTLKGNNMWLQNSKSQPNQQMNTVN